MSTHATPTIRGVPLSRLAVIAALGFTSCVGFAVSGMTNPGSLMNFMDMRRLGGVGEMLTRVFGREPVKGVAAWDPSVLIVFATALGTQLPLYQMLVGGNKSEKTEKEQVGQAASKSEGKSDEKRGGQGMSIDGKLVGGAAMFGAGWALAGFCPGPAMAAAIAGAPNAGVFVGSAMIGMIISTLWFEYGFQVKEYVKKGKSNGLLGSLLGLGTLAAGLALSDKMGWRAPLASVAAGASGGVGKSTTGLFSNPFVLPITGGVIIGLSGFLYTYLLGEGKVMGLSGMINQQLKATASSTDRVERFTFLSGLALAALIARSVYPAAFISSAAIPLSAARVVLSGLMVGFGTSCSNGCTSGHGLAGISRFSLRSVIATATFFATNVLVSTFLL